MIVLSAAVRCLVIFVLSLATFGPAVAAAPAGAGTLLAKTPMDGAPGGAKAWRVRYRSFAEDGAAVEISGIVVVPATPAPQGGRDIVSWGHSTVGIAERCAPSETSRVYMDIAGLSEMLRHGWIVAATDFQGLGTTGPNPYLVGVSSGRAMLDAVRAARAVPGADASNRYALWGESQGAHASLWAAQLAPAYAPDLDLVGVAAAAPPTDIDANFYAITNPAVRALMTGYVSASWSKVYRIPLSTFASGIGRVLIHRLATDCLHLDTTATLANVTLLLASRQLPEHLGKPWTRPIQDNSVRPLKLIVPMLVAQGGSDDVVLTDVTQAFLRKSCAAGNAIRYLPVADATHSTISTRTAGQTVAWIADRFAGKPAQSDCAGLDAHASGEAGASSGAGRPPDKRS